MTFRKTKLASVLLLALVSYQCLAEVQLPADINKCHMGDVMCIAKSMQYVLRNYSRGYPELGLPPIDAIQVHNVTIAKAAAGTPVQLNFKFNTLTVYGIEKARVERIVGFGPDINRSKYEVYASVDELLLHGDYRANGKILLLNINGGGEAKLKFGSIKLGIRMRLKEVQRDGKRYAKILKIKPTLLPESLTMYLGNIVEGSKELSDSLNEVINENWQALWSELSPGVNKALSGILKSLIAGMLDTIPYDDVFLPN